MISSETWRAPLLMKARTRSAHLRARTVIHHRSLNPITNLQSSPKYFALICITTFLLQGVRSPVVGALSSEHGNTMANKLELANNMANMTKSNLDNIVGSLWQARQESSGSSRGDQVIKKSKLMLCGDSFQVERLHPTVENDPALIRKPHRLVHGAIVNPGSTKVLPKVTTIKGRVCGLDNGGENQGIWTLEPSQHSVGRTFNGSE